jgi:hypothetical protein
MTSTLLFYNIKIKVFILISWFIMLEYVILFIFIVFLFHPLQMDPLAKVIELVLLIYAGYKNALIGLFCALVFIYSLSLKTGAKESPKVPEKVVLDRMVPEESNRSLCTGKTTGDYSPKESYTAYNVDI